MVVDDDDDDVVDVDGADDPHEPSPPITLDNLNTEDLVVVVVDLDLDLDDDMDILATLNSIEASLDAVDGSWWKQVLAPLPQDAKHMCEEASTADIIMDPLLADAKNKNAREYRELRKLAFTREKISARLVNSHRVRGVLRGIQDTIEIALVQFNKQIHANADEFEDNEDRAKYLNDMIVSEDLGRVESSLQRTKSKIAEAEVDINGYTSLLQAVDMAGDSIYTRLKMGEEKVDMKVVVDALGILKRTARELKQFQENQQEMMTLLTQATDARSTMNEAINTRVQRMYESRPVADVVAATQAVKRVDTLVDGLKERLRRDAQDARRSAQAPSTSSSKSVTKPRTRNDVRDEANWQLS